MTGSRLLFDENLSPRLVSLLADELSARDPTESGLASNR